MTRIATVITVLAIGCGNAPSKGGGGNQNNANNVNNAQNVIANNVVANNVANNGATVVGLNDPCDGDESFTPNVVLSWFDEEYDTTLVYGATEETTPLRVRFDLGDEILCFPHIPTPPGSAAPEQPPRIEIAVLLEVRTDDNMFDETVAAMATANPFSEGVAFGGSIPSTDFGGDYDVDPQARYGFNGTAVLGTSTGTIQESVGNSVTPIGRWPAPF